MKHLAIYAALYELLSFLTEDERPTTDEQLGEDTVAHMSAIMTALEAKLDSDPRLKA